MATLPRNSIQTITDPKGFKPEVHEISISHDDDAYGKTYSVCVTVIDNNGMYTQERARVRTYDEIKDYLDDWKEEPDRYELSVRQRKFLTKYRELTSKYFKSATAPYFETYYKEVCDFLHTGYYEEENRDILNYEIPYSYKKLKEWIKNV